MAGRPGEAVGAVGGADVAGGDSLTIGASLRLALCDAADALRGANADAVHARLWQWGQEGLEGLPWLPGPVLDALAPLGIEVPRGESGRRLTRFLAGRPVPREELDEALSVVRRDAESTRAQLRDGERERLLRDEVRRLGEVLVRAYAQLSAVVVGADQEDVVEAAAAAADRLERESERARSLAAEVAGAIPPRLPEPPRLRRPVRRPPSPRSPTLSTEAVAALIFAVAAVVLALMVLSAVLSGRWP